MINEAIKNDLERCKKDFNAGATLDKKIRQEVSPLDYPCERYQHIGKKIDHLSSINLYDLVKLFNEKYCMFYNEYNKLSKLKISKEMGFLNFNILKYYGEVFEKNIKNDNYRSLKFWIEGINENLGGHNEQILLLTDYTKERPCAIITNGQPRVEKEYYGKWYYAEDLTKIGISETIINNYLNFFQKHQLFLDSYNFFKGKYIFGNGISIINSCIVGNVLDVAPVFILETGNFENDYILIYFKLGEDLHIVYDKCKLIFNLQPVSNDMEIIDYLLKNLYITRTALPDLYSTSHLETKSKVLKK